MDLKGVITADIVQSTLIEVDYRKDLLDAIKEIVEELQGLSPMWMELYRGDSFQLLIDNPEEALKIAVLIRAGLQSRTPDDSLHKWDARLALGIGTVEYHSDNIATSDGEAFRNSGWEFDELGKYKLAIRTPWMEINEEFRVSTAFADNVISEWSVVQAKTIYESIRTDLSQKKIANNLETTSQNISKRLLTAKEPLIKLYLDRYKNVIAHKK